MGYSVGNVVVTAVHVLSAILAVGGVAFLRFVALPFAEGLPDAEKQRFQQAIRKRFVPILHGSFAMLFLTGIHHITRLALNRLPFTGALVAKIVLALAIIFIGVALTMPSGFAGMKARRKQWLLVNLCLALVVVFLGVWVTHRERGLPCPSPGPPASGRGGEAGSAHGISAAPCGSSKTAGSSEARCSWAAFSPCFGAAR